MIAQILLSNRRGEVDAARSAGFEDSRAAEVGVRCVRCALAIALAPALLTMLAVGGVGAVLAWMATSAAASPKESPRLASRTVSTRRHTLR